MNNDKIITSLGTDRGGTWTRIVGLNKSFGIVGSEKFKTTEDLNELSQKLINIAKNWNAISSPLVVATRGAMSNPNIKKTLFFNLLGKTNIKDVISDAEAAHLAAFDGKDGILLLSGTGSVALKGNPKHYKLFGGANPISGDPGSGRWLGIKYLQTKGRLNEAEKLGHGATAAYASELLKSAQNNEAAYLRIAQEGANHLAQLLKSAGYDCDKIKVALAGGLMHSEFYLNLIKQECRKVMPDKQIEFITSLISAEEASARYAAKLV